jgi:putative OPT family oligopeptide transporter
MTQDAVAEATPNPESPSDPDDQAGLAHVPYVGDHVHMREFTWSAVLMGGVLGIVFGASSLYLVLKVGMTVSASIPVAVLSITLFRVFTRVFGIRRATILENNIVQTAGSAGEAIAAGIGVTMPALMLLGFEMEVGRVMVIAALGGALGILMMIPLRRGFMVKQHGKLAYPEGTACADVLIVGEQGGASALTVFTGFGIGFVYQFFSQGLKLWKEVVARPLAAFHGAVPAIEVNPALLGVGYIIGRRIACTMAAGGIIASFVLIPAIRFFGDGLPKPLYPATKAIAELSEEELTKTYVLYIGAGAVAAGGIICVFRALPMIVGSVRAGLRDVRGMRRGAGGAVRRTDRDLSFRFVGIGTLVLLLLIWATLPLGTLFGWVNFLGAVLIMLFGALFVTVSSRLVGEIGSTSNPLSGMTVATLLLTCLIFLTLGWTDTPHRLVAISVAAVVCVAASNAGSTSQDLKTGFLIGATPRYQQIAILIGSTTSALFVGVILVVLNQGSTVYSTRDLPHDLNPPLNVADLPDLETAPGDETKYHVWRPPLGNEQGVPEGKYLVDEQGQPRYRVDPGINGIVDRRDDGTEVPKFKAPKSRLMGMITQGILTQKLPWTLVLLGVFITIALEMCGVSALPFAVGVYLPLSSSAPIFFGGMIRWLVDLRNRPNAKEALVADNSDMSPGVLLATGYIAGGAICGVLLAFVAFSEEIPKRMAAWQYGHATVAQRAPLADQFAQAAEQELHVDESATGQAQEDRKRLAAQISELNADLVDRATPVPAGMVLRLPKDATFTAPTEMTLGDVARQSLGAPEKAALLFELNKAQLKKPDRLPPGTELRMPPRNWPALTAFSILGVVLIVVGMGWWLKSS